MTTPTITVNDFLTMIKEKNLVFNNPYIPNSTIREYYKNYKEVK